MTPLASLLVGDGKNTGIFATQSELAKKIATFYGEYYPNKASIRPLITQVLAGKRKVPKKLNEELVGLLDGMSANVISAVKKEIQNHNNHVVPLLRVQNKLSKLSGSDHNWPDPNMLCRTMLRNQISKGLREKPFEQVARAFGVECREARPGINDEELVDLFFDLLKEIARGTM